MTSKLQDMERYHLPTGSSPFEEQNINEQSITKIQHASSIPDKSVPLVQYNRNNMSKNRSDHDAQYNCNTYSHYEKLAYDLQEENLVLKKKLESNEQIRNEYDEQIKTLELRIQELEDWNEDFRSNRTEKTVKPDEEIANSRLRENMSQLTLRNTQLEHDLQRLQSQHRNNQLALERLDEYEETINQLQEEIDQLRSNKTNKPIDHKNELNNLLIEEQKRYNDIYQLLEEARLKIENSLTEKLMLEHEIEIERKRNESLQIQINELQQFKDQQSNIRLEEEENHKKEIHLRQILERQLIDLNEEVQLLQNEKSQLNNRLDEFRLELESRDRQIQGFPFLTITPGSPPSNHETVSSLTEITERLRTFELENHQYKTETNSICDQFLSLLPSEFNLSDHSQLSPIDRFNDLFEQYSTYIGTFSITQEELDSLKQILNEKQEEIEKLRTHLELATDRLTRIHEEESLSHKQKSFDSDEDELEDILQFQNRAPSRQSLLSITPGEKQQLMAQNEILSSLLIEKEQELISYQQAEKVHEDLLKDYEKVRSNLQQIEHEKETKEIELIDIKNILDEKIRENSSLKKEKIFFIEKLAEYERQRHEQQSIIYVSSQRSSQEREKSPLMNHSQENRNNIEEFDRSDTEKEELLAYCNRLDEKYKQLLVDYESVQSLLRQKNEAYLQCQNELNVYQNLFYNQKKKSDDIDFLRSKLTERESQVEQLIFEQKQLEENSSKWISNQQLFEQMKIDLKRSTYERDIAIVEKKQLENQIELNRENVLNYEERLKNLSNQIEQYQQLNNQQEFELLKCEYAKAQEFYKNLYDQLQDQIKYSQSLQISLETFQQKQNESINDKLCQYQNDLQEQKSIIAHLRNENNEMAAKELFLIQRINELEENLKTTNLTRVEKQLAKNMLLSYFHTPVDKQAEVIPLLGALFGFTQDDYQKAMNAITHYNNINNSNVGTNWLSGWLSITSAKSSAQSNDFTSNPNKSFAELLIQYVDQQSTSDNDDVHVSMDKQFNSLEKVDEHKDPESSPTSPPSSIMIDDLLKI